MNRFPDLSELGRVPAGVGTPVNPRVERASTLLFDRAEDLYRTDVRGYGRHGSAVHDALAEVIGHIEGGEHVSLTPSGLSACTLAIMALCKSGDHILVSDSVYGPTRFFCRSTLKQFGIETEFYDPRAGAAISNLFRDNTALVVMESPGSLTLEIQDIPAIVTACRGRGIRAVLDNTWSAGLTLKPLELGVDASIQACTKYYSGHSDVLSGAVISKDEAIAKRVSAMRKSLGHSVSSDDAYLVLRGLRTLTSRFAQAETSSEAVATSLIDHPKIAQVLHPALQSHPDHALWKQQFTGGGCLFSFTLRDADEAAALRFINALHRFGIGYSYGGFESLAIHCGPQLRREFDPKLKGPLIRLACGTEPTEALVSDVKRALEAV